MQQCTLPRSGGDPTRTAGRARSAVTQSGCRRGILRRVGPASRESVARSGLRPERQARKRGGPQDRQRDATSPQRVKRRKPSRWRETTGMERDFGGGNPRSRSDGRPPAQEWTLHLHVDGGAKGTSRGTRYPAVWTETQERRSVTDQGVRCGSGEERKREARTAVPSGVVERAASGRPRGPTGDGEGRGGGGEAKPTATLVDRVITFYRKAKGDHEPHSA